MQQNAHPDSATIRTITANNKGKRWPLEEFCKDFLTQGQKTFTEK